MLKFALLGFLNYQAMTGYDLKQIIDESSAHFWHAYHSQIYTTLRKMEQDNLVTSRFVQEDSSPDRRIYTITPAGKTALKAWLDKTPTEKSPVKEELLVRLFFSAGREPQEVLAELRLQRELHQEQAAAYQTISVHLADQMAKNVEMERDTKFWQLTLNMGISYEQMYLTWLDNTIRTIEAL